MVQPVLSEIKVGTVLTVTLKDDDPVAVLAIVNGPPYIMSSVGKDGFSLIVRIPCHLPQLDSNVDVAGTNVVREGWSGYDQPI